MSLKNYYNQIQEIRETSSTNDKIDKLRNFMEDEVFVQILQFAYSEKYQYGIQKMSKFNKTFFTSTVEQLFDFLRTLSEQRGTSDADKMKLAQLASIDKKTYQLVGMIVQKDLKAGFSGKSINKAVPDTIFVAPYMRCSTTKQIDRIEYPAIVQEKADGVFVNFLLDDLEFRTRNWKKVHQLEHLFELFKTKHFQARGINNTVFHGELLVKKDDEILDRKTGNGIINSCLNGTADPEDAKCVIFVVWDCVTKKGFFDGKCSIPYEARVKHAKRTVKLVGSKQFRFIETKIVNDYAEAQKFYKKMRAEGKEGAVLKNKLVEWKSHTSPEQIKLKNEEEAELKIVGWKTGKKGTKYENFLGAITCESECGELNVSVGSGFSDELRKQDWDNFLGRIVTVAFESVIKDKNSKKPSLFLPRFKSLRSDRDIADTLEEIQKR